MNDQSDLVFVEEFKHGFDCDGIFYTDFPDGHRHYWHSCQVPSLGEDPEVIQNFLLGEIRFQKQRDFLNQTKNFHVKVDMTEKGDSSELLRE